MVCGKLGWPCRTESSGFSSDYPWTTTERGKLVTCAPHIGSTLTRPHCRQMLSQVLLITYI